MISDYTSIEQKNMQCKQQKIKYKAT